MRLSIFVWCIFCLNCLGQTNPLTTPSATDSTDLSAPAAETTPQIIDVSAEVKTLPKITVAVDLTSSHKGDSIKSYVERELRKLGDIKLVDANESPLVTIHLVVQQTETVAGYNSGYAISYCVSTDATKRLIIAREVKLKIPFDTAYQSGIFLNTSGTFMDQRIAVCGPDDLSSSIEESVAAIDANDIDILRKVFLKD